MPTRRAFHLSAAVWLGGMASPAAQAQSLAQAQAQAQARAASPPWPEVLAALPQARLLGAGRLRFWGLDVYDAQLWVPAGFAPAQFDQHTLALSLTYLRALKGRLIAERSLKEMQAQAPLNAANADAWLHAMTTLFPDVQTSDRLTGVHQPGREAGFWLNGQPLGAVADAAFGPRFFAIWLAATSSEPALRKQLLGLA